MTLGSMMDPQAMQGAMMPPPGMPPGGMGMAPPPAPPPAQPQRSPQQFALDLRAAMGAPNVLAAISQLVEDYGMPPTMVAMLLMGDQGEEQEPQSNYGGRTYSSPEEESTYSVEGALPNGGNVGPATSKSYGSGEPNLGMRNSTSSTSSGGSGGNAKHSYSGGSKATDGSGGAPIKTNMGSPDPGAVRNNEYGYPTSKKKRRY